ncbi:MAG: hypothetical protein QM520_01765 [Gammaproteobacteria bacterium]|nr:hypothetical protein [Gammaproteobacteria bacterium]
MIKLKAFVATLLIPALLVACNDGTFSGNSQPKTASDLPTPTYSLPTRNLPSQFTTGTVKAVAYSAYRGTGPGTSDSPTDAHISQDLGLLSTTGFTLLRMFGSDDLTQRVLRIAQQSYPNLKFQLGIYLQVPAVSCNSDAVNQAQIKKGIELARSFDNIIAVSVGNEVSLTGSHLLMSCMVDYIKTVKTRVPQPVTADDDVALYTNQRSFTHAGKTYSGADLLPWLDFLSVHTYPMSNANYWDWQSQRVDAQTLMTAAIDNAKSHITSLRNYAYSNQAGLATTVGSSMPIIIGETGWKARITNSANPLESATAGPVNAKMYYDMLVAWQNSGGTSPKTIVYFEAFDETWKGSDDGWGLWDENRVPRYALCGTLAPSAPDCSANIYQGAKF